MIAMRSVYAPESSSKIEGGLYVRIHCVPDNSRFIFNFDFSGDPDKLLIRWPFLHNKWYDVVTLFRLFLLTHSSTNSGSNPCCYISSRINGSHCRDACSITESKLRLYYNQLWLIISAIVNLRSGCAFIRPCKKSFARQLKSSGYSIRPLTIF